MKNIQVFFNRKSAFYTYFKNLFYMRY